MTDIFDIFLSSLSKYKNPTKWDNSYFEEIKKISNTHVGSVGQDFIESLCNNYKIEIEFPEANGKRLNQNSWDMKINGMSFELKTATEDTNKQFQFNHLRYHREYEAVLCLGVAPNNLYFVIFSKADIATGKAGNLVSMEKAGNASYKLTKRASQMFEINEFYEKISAFTNKK